MPLHTNKINVEKNAFVEELFSTLPDKEACVKGTYEARARSLHRLYLPLYILRTFGDEEKLNTEYFDVLVSQAIESESSFILGLHNLGMNSLRGLMDSSFKLLYFEYHPIEYELHKKDEFRLRPLQYRDFLYSYPKSKTVEALTSSSIEGIWKKLCGHVHGNLKTITTLTLVQDMTSTLSLPETKWQKTISTVKDVVRVAVIVSFMVRPDLGENLEKVYYDEVFRLFKPTERKTIQTAFDLS